MTVIVEENTNETFVDVIVSGGKESLSGASLGAEKSAMNKIMKLLRENGYSKVGDIVRGFHTRRIMYATGLQRNDNSF